MAKDFIPTFLKPILATAFLSGCGTMGWIVFEFGVSRTEAVQLLITDTTADHDTLTSIKQEVHDLHKWYREDHRK